MANVRYHSRKGKSEKAWDDAVRRVADVRRCGGFLIGITSKPSERAKEYGDVYADMRVLYSTNSASEALKFGGCPAGRVRGQRQRDALPKAIGQAALPCLCDGARLADVQARGVVWGPFLVSHARRLNSC